MATLEELHEVMSSVELHVKEQSSTLNELLKVQNKIYKSQQREYEKNKVKRSNAPSSEPDGASPNDDASKPDFDFSSLGKLAILAQGLVAGVGLAIGVLQGQLVALRTFFSAFTPRLFKTFENFKNSLSTRVAELLKDLRIRAAFIRVSIEEFFTNAARNIRTLFAIDESSMIGRIAIALRTSIRTLIAPFVRMVETITSLVSGPVNVLSETFSGIRSLLVSLGNSIARVASVVGRIFAPIAIIMTAFDTIRGALDGYAEDGLLGGLRGAIDGFFTSLITVPLDLLRNITAWVVDGLGFENAAGVLRSFSFTELWTNMTGAIFDGIESAINWIRTMFTNPVEGLQQLWSTALGGAEGLLDIMWYPINQIITWIGEKFGWRDEDAPDFSLREYIDGVLNTLRERFITFGEYISSLPERIGIEAQIMWVTVKEKLQLGFLDIAEWLSSIPKKMLAMLMNLLSNARVVLPDNAATRFLGIDGLSFGLVDEDAVAAANAAAEAVDPQYAERRAEITGNALVERGVLQDRLARIEEMLSANTGANINIAPVNIAPVTSATVSGGSSSTVINSLKESNKDLMDLAIPGGVG